MAENGNKDMHQRIIYVEPNDVYDRDAGNAGNGESLTPKYEDFCISFNLIIEAFSRFKSDATANLTDSVGESRKYSIQWGMTKDEMVKRRTSVLQGNRGDDILVDEDGSYAYSDSGYNFLTTYYTDLTHDSYRDKTQIEGLGVESVQVSYESWYTPTVTIKFIDVRGSALFGREEAVHVDEKLTAENIFGAFFTMPYPLFRLQVKGFLGKPVTYQLTCSGFKGEFNSQTGNFEAVATFIGYSWSLMTDIPFAYLVAAPYSPYIGAEYWRRNRNKERWGLWDDGDTFRPPMKLHELFENISAAIAGGEYGKATEEQSDELQSMSNEKKQLNTVSSYFNVFIESVRSKVDDRCIVRFDEETHNEQILLFSDSPSLRIVSDDEVAKNYEDFYTALETYSSGEYASSKDIGVDIAPNRWKSCPSSIAFKDAFTVTDSVDGDTQTITVNGVGTLSTESLMRIRLNETDGMETMTRSTADAVFSIAVGDVKNSVIRKYAYLLNLNNLNRLVNDRLNEIKKRENEILNEINDNLNINIIRILSTKSGDVNFNDGFKPFIGNIFKLIFCHLETFCHIMFDSADEIYRQMKTGYRLPGVLGISMSSTDTVPGVNESVTPWPAIYNNGIETSECGYKSEQSEIYGWVGDFPNHRFIEEKVVYGLQEGIQKVVSEKEHEYTATKFTGFPVVPSDFTSSGSVFGGASVRNISELSGHLATRIANIFGVTCGNSVDTETAKIIGRLDAYNLYDRVGSVSTLSDVVRNMTSDKVEGIMYCKQGDSECDTYAMQDRESSQNLRHHAFETRRIRYNAQGRHPFFIDKGNEALYVHFYDSDGLNYTPCTLRDFMHYANNRDEGDFSYRGDSIQNAVFTPNWDTDSDTLKRSRDWLYVSDSTKVSVVRGNEDIYSNRYMFDVITDNSDISSIRSRYIEIRDGNLKVGEYNVKDDLTAYIGKFMKVGDQSKSRFFKDVRYMLSGSIKDIGVLDVDLLPDSNLGGRLPERLNYDKWLKPDNGGQGNSVEVDSEGRLLLNGRSINLSELVIQQFKVKYLGNECNIFGCPFYYMQESSPIFDGESDEMRSYRVCRSKALLFLHTFKYDYTGTCLNVFDKAKRNGLVEEVPKGYLLFIGGNLWRKRYFKVHGRDPIVFSYGVNEYSPCSTDYTLLTSSGTYTEFNIYKTNPKYNFPVSSLLGGDSEIDCNIENRLISLFEEFAMTTFKDIANRYELTSLVEGKKRTYTVDKIKYDIYVTGLFIESEGTGRKVLFKKENVKKDANPKNFIEWLTKYGFDGWLGRYSAVYVNPNVDINANIQGFSLLFNEKDTRYQEIFKDLYFNSYIIADSCYRRMGRDTGTVSDSDMIRVDKSLLKSYLSGFKGACDNILTSETVTLGNSGLSVSKSTLKNRDLSLAIYYYLKNLWDKWLVIADKNAFDVDVYFNRNFVFTDSFYKNIYHLLAVNCDNLLSAWKELADNGSLFHFLSRIVSDHGCIFLPVPDYVGFNGETQQHDIETMEDLFRPLGYNAIEAPSNSNKFVVMYTHSPSHIATEDNGYKSDTYDIWSHELNSTTDTASRLFSTTNSSDFDRTRDIATREGYNVPSFGVSFGRQNNHIFKNLRLTMDNPVMTEQAIKAMWHIALKGSSSTHSLSFIGQDTFNVFTNYSYSVEIEMMGNAQICPLMYFQLTNVPMWRGTYMIYKVVHSMTAGNMTTTITGVKMNKYAQPFNTSFFVIHELPPVNGDDYRLESDCDDSSDTTAADTGLNDDTLFRSNPNGWKLKEACEWLNSNAGGGSQGKCARYVRMAIEKGGITTEGRPLWAWMYVNYLPTIGFKHILHHVKGKTDYTPEAGDIAVYKKAGRTDVPGHICMYTGKYWCSDFRQRNMYVYTSTTEADIFRFQGKE